MLYYQLQSVPLELALALKQVVSIAAAVEIPEVQLMERRIALAQWDEGAALVELART